MDTESQLRQMLDLATPDLNALEALATQLKHEAHALYIRAELTRQEVERLSPPVLAISCTPLTEVVPPILPVAIAIDESESSLPEVIEVQPATSTAIEELPQPASVHIDNSRDEDVIPVEIETTSVNETHRALRWNYTEMFGVKVEEARISV